ncbi:hypothetical protein [Phyllobacterium sp. SB3]|uniref:hypothetical protein n=1 Tax=Phyllobacterium sp. SB3 TaxID=3156073 RepID=UPI0032AF8FBD
MAQKLQFFKWEEDSTVSGWSAGYAITPDHVLDLTVTVPEEPPLTINYEVADDDGNVFATGQAETTEEAREAAFAVGVEPSNVITLILTLPAKHSIFSFDVIDGTTVLAHGQTDSLESAMREAERDAKRLFINLVKASA